MRRVLLLLVVAATGCGRYGLPLVDDGNARSCGAGTYASGDECLPIGGADPGGGGLDAAIPHGDGDGGFVRDGGIRDAGPVHDAAPPPDLGPPMPTLPGSAVTYQIDPAHTGGQPMSALRPPLTPRWSVTLDSAYLSYPLIVGDSVFVAGGGDNGTQLYALSTDNGAELWPPVALSGNPFVEMVSLAWDDGKVFTIDAAGLVQAFDAPTGTMLWSRALGDRGGRDRRSP